MKEKILYCIWACMYILCVGLACINDAQGFGKFVLVLISILFFVPGAMILYEGMKAKNKKALVRVRIISAASLFLTMVVWIINVMSISASEKAGDVLYEILILVSAPMVCSQYWVLSLFLWACLLMASFKKIKKEER